MTRLEYERRERGWSQRDLLREAGLGRGAEDWVSSVEAGMPLRTYGVRAQAIARALKLEPHQLDKPIRRPRRGRAGAQLRRVERGLAAV